MRFIHAADLHIDSPLRGLARYDGAPVERLRGATRRALEKLVDLALAQGVDFVLLAGDIYDRDWQDFHTGLFFREQMVRLGRANVQVFIAHGNHDAQGVISRQLSLPPNVTVFSHRKAECIRIESLAVAIHGRSFPDREVSEDLVPGYLDAVPGYFNIGVLHTSLTGRAGHDTYAPTRVDVLAGKGFDYWALGHVHVREIVKQDSPRIVFPGNLQGRHANESGAKGCELVTVEKGASMSAEFVPLDVVRWSRLDIDLSGVERVEAIAPMFHAALDAHLHGAAELLHAVRVNLRGSTVLHAVEAMSPGTLAAAVQAAAQDVSRAEVWIEQVRLSLTAPIDRSAAAERQDAVGELVRLVDAIAADDAELLRWGDDQLGALKKGMAPELLGNDMPRFDDISTLQALMLDAEATVLARLAAAAATPASPAPVSPMSTRSAEKPAKQPKPVNEDAA
ncbi:DNA repair exonuclease [soil metagenome]